MATGQDTRGKSYPCPKIVMGGLNFKGKFVSYDNTSKYMVIHHGREEKGLKRRLLIDYVLLLNCLYMAFITLLQNIVWNGYDTYTNFTLLIFKVKDYRYAKFYK